VILWASPIIVRTHISHILQKLIYEISVRSVNLYAVEPRSVYRIRGGRRVELDILLDLRYGERAGKDAICSPSERDVGSRDVRKRWVFGN
jgi:hypothetical protein